MISRRRRTFSRRKKCLLCYGMYYLSALSLSLSLFFCFRHASSSSSFVCVVVVFVCVAFVLCFWSSKTHTILGREKEKERINPTQTLNPKKHTKTHVKKEREGREVLEREKNTHCACFSTYYSPFMTPKESATKQTPSSIPPPPPPPQQSLLSSSFSVSSKKSVFLGLLRKARTERRANLATRHLRRGEFARYFRETTVVVGGTTTTKKMSRIALAAKATEMTRTQKRINRGGY